MKQIAPPFSFRHSLTKFLAVASGLLLVPVFGCNQDDRVAVLVARSAAGEPFFRRTARGDRPLKSRDVAAAEAYILGHPDRASYHLLMVMRRDYPDRYSQISGPVRAAVLCSPLADRTVLNDWGYLSPGG